MEREGIHASPEALEETNRLQAIFDKKVEMFDQKTKNYWKVCFLNIRSLRCNQEHVMNDNFLMSADILGLGETWLENDEEKEFSGFKGIFANYGRGKGIAAFNKINCIKMNSLASEKLSCIHLRNDKFDVIFVYASTGCQRGEIVNLLETWVDHQRPTVVMGDFNVDYDKDNKFIKSLEENRFFQLMYEATCDTGSLIDHIYVNKAMKALNVTIQRDSTYYSDHDAVTIHIPK